MLRDTSTNGTYVDGEEVGRNQTVELLQGSIITLLVGSIDERDAEFGNAIPVRRTGDCLRTPARRLPC